MRFIARDILIVLTVTVTAIIFIEVLFLVLGNLLSV